MYLLFFISIFLAFDAQARSGWQIPRSEISSAAFAVMELEEPKLLPQESLLGVLVNMEIDGYWVRGFRFHREKLQMSESIYICPYEPRQEKPLQCEFLDLESPEYRPFEIAPKNLDVLKQGLVAATKSFENLVAPPSLIQSLWVLGSRTEFRFVAAYGDNEQQLHQTILLCSQKNIDYECELEGKLAHQMPKSFFTKRSIHGSGKKRAKRAAIPIPLPTK